MPALVSKLTAVMVAAAAASSALAQAPQFDPTATRLLASHNAERAAVALPPLIWDPALAAAAASYGPALAAHGMALPHSPRASRPGQRENLWVGTAGAYTPEQMVGTWISERRYFRSGVFPNVSTTGNWVDVAHYTTMVWPTTTRVGCAIYRARGFDYLVCRYSPPGNIDGRPLVLPPRAPRG